MWRLNYQRDRVRLLFKIIYSMMRKFHFNLPLSKEMMLIIMKWDYQTTKWSFHESGKYVFSENIIPLLLDVSYTDSRNPYISR